VGQGGQALRLQLKDCEEHQGRFEDAWNSSSTQAKPASKGLEYSQHSDQVPLVFKKK